METTKMRLSFEDASMVGFPVELCDSPVEQSNATELDLVRQMQTGNVMAYRKFVEGYQSQVFRVAYQILGNREEADEIAQKVFAKIYYSVKGFDARRCLYTWVFGIAVNECYGFLRTKWLNVPNEISPDARPTSERAILRRDLLNRLLERIPAEDRRLLLLRELEGYSVAKLSEVIGLDENTIKTRLFRTRQRLVKAAAQ
jgi:RNA polymerase sigma-70 factor (ECF subfamily)